MLAGHTHHASMPTNLYCCIPDMSRERMDLIQTNSHRIHESAGIKNTVISTCSPAQTPASQLQFSIKPTVISADYWQVSDVSTLPNKTLQMNAVLYAGPAHPLPCQITRRALYSLHGCLPRRCQPRVRVQGAQRW